MPLPDWVGLAVAVGLELAVGVLLAVGLALVALGVGLALVTVGVGVADGDCVPLPLLPVAGGGVPVPQNPKLVPALLEIAGFQEAPVMWSFPPDFV